MNEVMIWAVWFVQVLASIGIVALTGGILLCLLRVVRGPTLADRGVGVDAMGIQVLGLVIVLTLRGGELVFVDGMLVLALLSFAGTVAIAQFIARPHIKVEEAEATE
jgi:multisubunit Na+/H+ antiporter MnhF subunit